MPATCQSRPTFARLRAHFALYGERVENLVKLKCAVQRALKTVQDGTTAISTWW
jgi:hypothetical protein